jgi:hypothetical protein
MGSTGNQSTLRICGSAPSYAGALILRLLAYPADRCGNCASLIADAVHPQPLRYSRCEGACTLDQGSPTIFGPAASQRSRSCRTSPARRVACAETARLDALGCFPLVEHWHRGLRQGTRCLSSGGLDAHRRAHALGGDSEHDRGRRERGQGGLPLPPLVAPLGLTIRLRRNGSFACPRPPFGTRCEGEWGAHGGLSFHLERGSASHRRACH